MFGIPEDKFEYILKMIKSSKVTISAIEVPYNDWVDLEKCRQHEELVINKNDPGITTIAPRQFTMDMFRHIAVILKSESTTRKVMVSLRKMVRNASNKLVPNLYIRFDNDVPKNLRGVYYSFWLLGGVLVPFWEFFVSDDIYMWAEKKGCGELLEDDNSYLYETFDYYKDVTQSLIDIFGRDTIDKVVCDLSVCGHCGEKFGKEE